MIYLCNIKQIFIIIMSNQYKYKIKELISAQNIEQADLADHCRKSRQTISNWCNIPVGSTSKIPRMALHDIADFFGCSVSELYTNTSDAPITRSKIYKAVI